MAYSPAARQNVLAVSIQQQYFLNLRNNLTMFISYAQFGWRTFRQRYKLHTVCIPCHDQWPQSRQKRQLSFQSLSLLLHPSPSCTTKHKSCQI